MKNPKISACLIIVPAFTLAAGTCAAGNPGIALQGLEGRYAVEERTTVYVAPERIVWSRGDISGAERLLQNDAPQATERGDGPNCVLRNPPDAMPGAALLLDFGKELQGGITLSAAGRKSKSPVKIRVRLGESVAEAMSDVGGEGATATNEHSLRDFTLEVPWLGQVETGNSGFRFVRIDLLDADCELPLKNIKAVFRFRDIPYPGSFECSDQRLTQIWETGAYTVHLNMQDYIWDGIKRDRLVWLGDLHPELMTINNVFGHVPVLNATLDFGRDNNTLPGWMNGISSYSLWWIISHRDLYLYQGDLKYLRQQHGYLKGLTEQIIDSTDGSHEAFAGHRFLDWPTSENPAAIHAGMQSLCVMALEAAAEIGSWLGDGELSRRCGETAARLREYCPPHGGNKQAAALLSVSGLGGADEMNAVIAEDGVKDFSTFYGYYMLEAMAKAGAYERAMDAISAYWGAMLDLGATTFWEDLDYEDALKASRIDELIPEGGFDIHGDSGQYCYAGFRHSFCHGWASGPTAWMTRHILGFQPLEPGCRMIVISPNLGNLEWAKGSLPTPYGVVRVEHAKDKKGNIVTRVNAPEGIGIIKGGTVAKIKALH